MPNKIRKKRERKISNFLTKSYIVHHYHDDDDDYGRKEIPYAYIYHNIHTMLIYEQ